MNNSSMLLGMDCKELHQVIVYNNPDGVLDNMQKSGMLKKEELSAYRGNPDKILDYLYQLNFSNAGEYLSTFEQALAVDLKNTGKLEDVFLSHLFEDGGTPSSLRTTIRQNAIAHLPDHFFEDYAYVPKQELASTRLIASLGLIVIAIWLLSFVFKFAHKRKPQ